MIRMSYMSSGGYSSCLSSMTGSDYMDSRSALESTVSECASCSSHSRPVQPAPASYSFKAPPYGPITYTARSPAVIYAGDTDSSKTSSVYSGNYSDPVAEIKKQTRKEYDVLRTKLVFRPGQFINPSAPKTKFIRASEQVKELVEQTFIELTGKELPCLNIDVCSEKELRKEHARLGGQWSPGILGFCNHSTGSIFVLENNLAELLLTIGHEIGHLLSEPLPDLIDEEAKAMAFASAWAQAIHENNIGNLGSHIQMHQPATNGVHNVASHFVNNMLDDGMVAMDVFEQLSRKYISSSFCRNF
ncbi:hypothetical protein GF371_01400 [Candidatus Woesearchaeota archaeon]|nr:hypothetical protein [Candidatus Woesearchaeota archaeon]